MEKPKSVEVGQLWMLEGLDSRPYAVTKIDDGVAYFDGGGCNPTDTMLTNPEWEFHGHDGGRRCGTCNGVHGEPACPPGWHSKTPPSPLYGRTGGERRDQDGTPLTALEAIRGKVKPEPWVPSVTEWDLLPDV